jgi:polysaccharide deacetylase 2 family uncharacterized protein YibQ
MTAAAERSLSTQDPAHQPEHTDDLSKPLGQDPKAKKRRFAVKVDGSHVARGFAGVLGACMAVFIGWILFVDDPSGGEPLAIVSANTSASPQNAKGAAPAPKPDGAALAPNADAAKPADGNTITIIDGSTGRRQEIPIAPGAKQPAANSKSGANAGAAKPDATVDPRLLEQSRHGVIPKIAPDGARPSDTYSKPVKPQAGRGDLPRVAIVIEGLGVGGAVTTEAFAKLPAPVTYAFAAHAGDLERWVTRARGEGHEVLLQVGMEPFDYPDNDPGPQTLLTSNSPEQNVDRLHWYLSRVQGYVGVTSQMGARFTAADQAFTPVLREIGRRGLIYFDNGASPRSVAGQVSGAHNVAFAKADIVLDTVPVATEIDGALARLEAAAREHGYAIASASALPVTVDRLSQWVKSADARGITLVPISQVASRARNAS